MGESIYKEWNNGVRHMTKEILIQCPECSQDAKLIMEKKRMQDDGLATIYCKCFKGLSVKVKDIGKLKFLEVANDNG